MFNSILFIILKEKRYKKHVIIIEEIINFRINNLLNFVRIRIFFKTSLNLTFDIKFIKLFNIFDNNIIYFYFYFYLYKSLDLLFAL